MPDQAFLCPEEKRLLRALCTERSKTTVLCECEKKHPFASGFWRSEPLCRSLYGRIEIGHKPWQCCFRVCSSALPAT